MAAILQDPRQPPPWTGNVQSSNQFPFEGADHNLFPPVCIRNHWDPEQIIRRTLPNTRENIPAPLDPRPWTKICMSYTTTADFEDAPRPDDYVVFPSGGSVYPPTRYREAIDKESLLRRLDRPLDKWCDSGQYIPPRDGDMYRPNATVEDRGPVSTRFIQELSFPMACMRGSDYDCRQQEGQKAWERSPRLFNNTTKQDRYAISRPDLAYATATGAPQPSGPQN
jgi:hypothetical protein